MASIKSNPCSYRFNQEESASHVVLTFKRGELLYDIRNYAYIEGHIMPDDAEHAKHTVVDVGEEGNVDRVTRLLNLYHRKCVEMLYPYSKYPVIHAEEDEEPKPWSDVLEESDEYQIHLEFPANFSHTTVDLLQELIHEFLVTSVLADWLSIFNTQQAATWQAKAEKAKEDILSCIHNRRGNRVRLKCHPF